MSHQASPWLAAALNKKDIAKVVRDAAKALKSLDFDTIAFRGISGALIAPIVAYKMKKEIACVRKPHAVDGDTHSYYAYEGYQEVKQYVIIDDFVCTGDTCAKIIEAVRKENIRTGHKPLLVGLYTYYHGKGEKAGLHLPTKEKEIMRKISLCLGGDLW